ncbi:MAG TPA: prepilin-type N-terminal cleavage/methylation domain-containing protein [Stellaceae bacterium]|nr:prepilin-type N-terminal cleavage/methylation domain-containing protein [Stellaceae bacterium]
MERRAEHGFTLLEMLVALVVLGLLVAGLAQGVRTAFSMWSVQTRHIDQAAELDGAGRVMRALLSGMQPISPTGFASGAAEAPVIAGDASRLYFVGDLPMGSGTSRRADITIELQRGRVVLLWLPRDSGTPTGPPTAPGSTELVRGVESLEFAYWLPAPAEHGGGWLVRWREPALPKLVRVRLQFPIGDGRHWPDLVAAPLLWTPPAGSRSPPATSEH